jgi:hypothetical protein
MSGAITARRKANSAKIDPALFHRSASSVTLTEDVIAAYVSIMRAEGRTGSSLHLCETVLRQFAALLLEGGLAKKSLPAWREYIRVLLMVKAVDDWWSICWYSWLPPWGCRRLT